MLYFEINILFVLLPDNVTILLKLHVVFGSWAVCLLVTLNFVWIPVKNTYGYINSILWQD